ncbi:MAG: DUF3786 domain-containing protein [Planctomycetia bacterium]
MAAPKNAMEIFKLLDKSNCRECEMPTCLAFAAAVFKGEKSLGQCPHVDSEWIDHYGEATPRPDLDTLSRQEGRDRLKALVADIDLEEAAERLGGRMEQGRLIIKILGKDFGVDGRGRVDTDLHVHTWMLSPILAYFENAKGVDCSGNWVALRELGGSKGWVRFFEHRCEKPLKELADHYTDLFEDMIHLFNGRSAENHYQSDISLVLTPLPRVPVLICYWKPEDGLASSLNIFFDDQVEGNLPVPAIYTLFAGMVRMFEKIAVRHGVK